MCSAFNKTNIKIEFYNINLTMIKFIVIILNTTLIFSLKKVGN
jgi:hypothetical protein